MELQEGATGTRRLVHRRGRIATPSLRGVAAGAIRPDMDRLDCLPCILRHLLVAQSISSPGNDRENGIDRHAVLLVAGIPKATSFKVHAHLVVPVLIVGAAELMERRATDFLA